ncbi:ATP-grasp domain-containing protein [Novipirellula caenicola]|uniref:ATP-grasp domain-containing protein n=1 Tax=Novipirellula caenicola TaxID=1536901 RepID=A0ABP9W0W1_9BACT
MKWTDQYRLATCRIQRKPSVLFSRKHDWNNAIGQSLRDYVPFCYNLSDVNVRRFDLLFPLTVRDEKYFNLHHRSLHGQKAIVPSTEVIELCDDKQALIHRLTQYGFGEHMPATGCRFEYPYVVKKRVSGFGDGTFIIQNSDDERELETLLNAESHFTLEHISGQEEFATHLVIAKGQVVFSRTCKYFFPPGVYVKGRHGKPVKRQTSDHSPYTGLFEEMLRAIGYEGVCCIDYKPHGSGIKLLEINPRFGATMALFINEALPAYEAAVAAY